MGVPPSADKQKPLHAIDNYSIGQIKITAVIEEEMARLNFQGAGGIVEFNHYHGVSTPVEVY